MNVYAKPSENQKPCIYVNVARQLHWWECGYMALAYAALMLETKTVITLKELRETTFIVNELPRWIITSLESGEVQPLPTRCLSIPFTYLVVVVS